MAKKGLILVADVGAPFHLQNLLLCLHMDVATLLFADPSFYRPLLKLTPIKVWIKPQNAINLKRSRDQWNPCECSYLKIEDTGKKVHKISQRKELRNCWTFCWWIQSQAVLGAGKKSCSCTWCPKLALIKSLKGGNACKNAIFELGVVLHCEEKRVLPRKAFNYFKTFVLSVIVGATEDKVSTAQLFFVIWIDLEAMTMAFPKLLMTVNGSEDARIASQRQRLLAQYTNRSVPPVTSLLSSGMKTTMLSCRFFSTNCSLLGPVILS
jgi:hypothetical protein